MRFVNNQHSDDRIIWIDIAKGISILFIVLGHISDGFLGKFSFSFNSVVFFILAGMNFRRLKNKSDELLCFDNGRISSFLRKTGKRLFFPYFIWGSISIIIYYFVEGKILSHLQTSKKTKKPLISYFIALLYGNSETDFFEYYRPLWFLPCLIIVEIIWFLILKLMYQISKKRAWLLYGMSMLFFLLFGIMESCFKWNLILPFEIESAVFMSFFFGFGLMLRSRWIFQFLCQVGWIRQASILNNKKLHIFCVFVWLVIGFAGTYLNGGTDTRTDNFGNIGLFIWNALWMSLGIIYIAFIFQSLPLMEYLGKRTLAILVMHKYPIMALKLVPFVQEELQAGSFIVEIIVTVLTILCCLVAEKLIKRYLPQLFGRF